MLSTRRTSRRHLFHQLGPDPRKLTLKINIILVSKGEEVVALITLDRLDRVTLRVYEVHLDSGC